MTTMGFAVEVCRRFERCRLAKSQHQPGYHGPRSYKLLTRGGNIRYVFEGIEAAKKAKLEPIKINCVIQNTSQEKDAKEVADFCKEMA